MKGRRRKVKKSGRQTAGKTESAIAQETRIQHYGISERNAEVRRRDYTEGFSEG
jgi:hypothetical protein